MGSVPVAPPPEPEPELAAEIAADTAAAVTDTTDTTDTTDEAEGAEQAARRRPSRRRGGRRRGRGDGDAGATATDGATTDEGEAVATDESGDALAVAEVVSAEVVPAPAPASVRQRRSTPESVTEPMPVYSLEPLATEPEATADASPATPAEMHQETAPTDETPAPAAPRRRRRSGGRGRGAAQPSETPASEAETAANVVVAASIEAATPLAPTAPADDAGDTSTTAPRTAADTAQSLGDALAAREDAGNAGEPPALDAAGGAGARRANVAPALNAGAADAPDDRDAVPPPAGVEILAVTEGDDGVRHYAMRDRRSGRELADVTRRTARGQWRNALIAREDRLPREEEIVWHGARGYGRTVVRDGAAQHDLALRTPEGGVRLFYAVPDGDLDGAWRAVLP